MNFLYHGDVTDSTGVGRAQVACRGYDSLNVNANITGKTNNYSLAAA